jgi:hypothetical protein
VTGTLASTGRGRTQTPSTNNQSWQPSSKNSNHFKISHTIAKNWHYTLYIETACSTRNFVF